MRRTRKSEELLALIRRGAGEEGIYALAAAAGRPYRRVHQQVKRLAAEGLVHLERVPAGPRTAIRVRPIPARRLKLTIDRAWSRPAGGVADDTLIAQVLARPTFKDLLACVEHYGLERIQTSRADLIRAFELTPAAAETTGRMLKNIEIGRARAAGKH